MSNDNIRYLYEKDSLAHYASPYYDPVKAHEYYMRNRELKGRRSTSSLSDEGKRIWSYTKSQIGSEKQKKSNLQSAKQKAQIKKHRQRAKQARDRISDTLKRLNDALNEKAKQSRENISEAQKSLSKQRQEQIKELQSQKIPKGISKEVRARLAEEKKEKIAELREEGRQESAVASYLREQVSEKTKAQRKTNSESASKKRQRVANDLKNVISATREAYKKAKTQLDANYEKIYQDEYNKIAKEYRKPSSGRNNSK